jgi:hypothetical protein
LRFLEFHSGTVPFGLGSMQQSKRIRAALDDGLVDGTVVPFAMDRDREFAELD